MNTKRIALVIKTEGLEYDDRVRKEILTVKKLYSNIEFKIFVMLNNDNREYEGITSYGIPYKVVHLKSRDKYGSREGLIQKSIEFYRVICTDLKEFDAIWCADRHCFMVAALVKNKHILWDLHEIPYEFIGKKYLEWFLKYIFRRCKVVVHANPQRCEYMKGLGLISNPEKHFAIRNYPNFNDIDSNYDDSYNNFVSWKGERKCVYLQGLNNYGRAPYESITAVLKEQKLIAVVVGGFDKDALERLKKEWGSELKDRIYFCGKIPQLKIPQYVAQCFISLIFYKNIRPNNFFCEANRFYQSVIMGLPVVVGNNPPMKSIVDKYGFGISIDDDGSDVEKIRDGIHNVMNKYELIKKKNEKYRKYLIWDTQDRIFQQIVDKLFS